MAAPPMWSYSTVLTPEALSASLARDFVSSHLLRHGLPDLLDAVRLVTSELATNAMLHAATPFTLSLSRTDHSVLLVVADESVEEPVQVQSGEMDVGGRGLAIVAEISRAWGVTGQDDAKSVWAAFDVIDQGG